MDRDLMSRAFIALQSERGELVRLGQDIVSASTAEEQRQAIAQMRNYLGVLEERASRNQGDREVLAGARAR
jgi:hypothetical protein